MGFKSRPSYSCEVFHVSFHLITFREYVAYLAHDVHKNGNKLEIFTPPIYQTEDYI